MTLRAALSKSFAVGLSAAAGSLLAVLFVPPAAFAASEGAAEVGRIYALPPGNHVPRVAQSMPQMPPSSDVQALTELRRLKSLAGGPKTGDRAFAPAGGSVQPAAILQECATSSQTGDSPGSPHGAVSALRIVAVTIREVGVYNRTGCAIISRVTVATFFAGGFASAADDSFFDTRVIYDFTSQRFLVSSRSFAGADQYQYFAVSTSDTGAAWRFFRIRIISSAGNKCVSASETGWTGPSPGVNAFRWLIVSQSGTILSLDKAPTIAASGSPKFKCFNLGAGFMQPPIVRGNSLKAYFLSAGAQQGFSLQRYQLTVGAAVKNDVVDGPTFIDVPDWTAPPNAPQPNGQELDTFDGSFRSASIQIGSFLWNVHTINVNGEARWRLYKLPTTDLTPLLVFTPDTVAGIHHSFNASVATGSASQSARAFVTFSRTRPGSATGRAEMVIAKGPNSSASGWTSQSIQRSATEFEFFINGSVTCNAGFGNACRWGEYSATQVDPLDVKRAWGFNQLVNGTTQTEWVTRAGQID